MLRFIALILIIVFLSALMEWDACNCGMGPAIRKTVKSLFQPIERKELPIDSRVDSGVDSGVDLFETNF